VTREFAFFPDWRHFNPFQTMLFGDLERVGAAPRPAHGLRNYLAEATASGRPGLLNVHWTTPLLTGVADEAQARAKVALLGELLDAFRAAGGRLVWTVHNVLPHDPVHVECEVALARMLADRADLVHVLSEATLAAAAPYFEIDPQRTVCIPHSSYRGVYPDWVSRAGARRRLGVEPDESAVLALGQIRPYKGLDRLLDFVEGSDRPRLRLLVAGALRAGPESDELAERLAVAPRTTSLTRRLRDDEIQVWMRAADLAVLPYVRVLNSGAFLLAESFDLPVVGPRTGALVERESDAHVRLFDEDDFQDVLSAAVADLVEDPDGAARARDSAERAALSRPVGAMAASFADAVAPLLEFTEPSQPAAGRCTAATDHVVRRNLATPRWCQH
jgi:glycosyltransferase involved in cell wall biosynthesis